MRKYLSLTTRFVIIGLSPIIIIGAFWHVQLEEVRLFLLPLLGVLALVLGGVLGIGFAKWRKLDRAQTGSMFVSGSFTNIGSFGTLFCYVFLGEASIVFAAMYRLFEEFVYYLIGFPIAKLYGEQERGNGRRREMIRKLVTDPFIMASFCAIVLGGVLNFSPVARPEFYSTVIEILVPLTTFLLVLPIGFNMKIKAIQGYIKECLAVSVIKFVLVPVTITSLAVLLGMGQLYDGMVLKVIIILSAMPPAFISLIPPQLYKLDQDLANSSWLLNTGLLLIVLPFLYFIVGSF
ncbi:AEC family transporter [Xylanibacillus composti]|uniref:AEC family transporter n=1 Tax=Xylanibacillus composti TaxID=1572762 RepID=UPI001BD194FB|nr:AEC family transporter [Xylanibacillus composti]